MLGPIDQLDRNYIAIILWFVNLASFYNPVYTTFNFSDTLKNF